MSAINTSSFWKKDLKKVPGYPSPVNVTSKMTSFQDFQLSVDDAWTINGNDDDFNTSNITISKKLCNSVALNVLNNFNSLEIESIFIKAPDDENEWKLKRFQIILNNPICFDNLCEISWSGIPNKVRPIIWRLLSGYLPLNVERRKEVLKRKRADYWGFVEKYYYDEIDKSTLGMRRQISIDVPRMNPSIKLFQQKMVQDMFLRILYIWSIRHPASGYVQGLNDLVTPFFVVFLQEFIPNNEAFEYFHLDTVPENQLKILEADTFWCLTKFLNSIQDNYVYSQIGIQRKMYQLEELIKRVDEQLHHHLKNNDVSYLQFSFRWLNNLLIRELPLRCMIRLWDTYLAESESFAVFQLYVSAAFLLYWRNDLLKLTDFQGLLIFLQNLPTKNWTYSEINELVAEAYKLKVMFADSPQHLQICKDRFCH